MPEINVAKTDTFEIQRQKINQLSQNLGDTASLSVNGNTNIVNAVNYLSSSIVNVGAGEGITVNANNVALNITSLTADTIADADELAFYDTVDAVNGVGHNKITAANLALYVLQEATGDVTFDTSGTAQIADDSVDLGTHTTGQYASTITGGSGIAATAANADNATAYTIDLDINELTALDAEGGTDPLVVADSIAVYDASATENKKVTISNLETVIFADIGGDIAVAANGTATIQNNSVALGTKTTGNYVEDVTAGAGLAKTSSASEGQTVDLAVGAGEGITVNPDDVALNITGLTADTIADADELAFYDTVDAVNGVGHNKITASNLALYVLQEATGDVTFDTSGTAQIADDSVDLGTHTTGDYVATVSVTANGGISTNGASTGEGTKHALALDIDGMTDIGAALTDVDLIAVDDGGAGTNRKAAVTRISDYTFGKVSGDITIASNGTAAIGSGVIVDGDISATAEIAVSKLANGSARQLLQTDADGTGVEWATNIDVPGTLDVAGAGTFDSTVTITGTLLCGALHVTDTAGTNEAIVSYLAAESAPDGATAERYLQNLTIDAGTY